MSSPGEAATRPRGVAERRRAPLAVLLLAAAAPGCATVRVSSYRTPGVGPFPPTAPSSVEILRRMPRGGIVRLGEIVLRPSGAPTVERIEAALRTEAAAMGAQAVVVVEDRTRESGRPGREPGWGRADVPRYGRRITAVAVRYR